MTVLLVCAGIVCCLILSAFCSAAEMTYSSCNTLRLENARDDGSRRAAIAVQITERFDDALSAILIGNNLANIAGSSLASVLVILITKSDNYAWLATVIITLLVIFFGETIPKITAKRKANTLALRFAYIVRGMMLLLTPAVWLVVKLIHLLTGGLKGDDGDDSGEEAVEELQSLIETAEDEEVLDEDQSELVQAAIDFSDISASEVMTARVDVYAIDIEDDWENLIAQVEKSPYSRLPVYEGTIDHIVGMLYLNRFLKALTEKDGNRDLRSFLMPVCYVYKTMKLPEVLSLLRRAKQHLAVVVDEYGGTLGVVSMEDVLEQIVGDIWDENDEIEQEVIERSQGEYELDGDMTISDFLELTELSEDSFEVESETVGGWCVEYLGRFPQSGDCFSYENLTLTGLTMDGLRVDKLLLKLAPRETGEE